jgi:hypothetical protein
LKLQESYGAAVGIRCDSIGKQFLMSSFKFAEVIAPILRPSSTGLSKDNQYDNQHKDNQAALLLQHFYNSLDLNQPR